MKSKTIIPILILLIIITISIIYNTLPRLQLNGPQNMVISYRDEYEEQGVIVKNATGNYMSKIKIDSNIDTKKIGNYYVDYSLKIGGKTLHVRRNVKVVDDINPVIKLKGEQIIKISINKQYIEPGYIAIDEYDGDITNKVQITGEIDAENYGEYVLTYKATDNGWIITLGGLMIQKKRIAETISAFTADGSVYKAELALGSWDEPFGVIYGAIPALEDCTANVWTGPVTDTDRTSGGTALIYQGAATAAVINLSLFGIGGTGSGNQ